MLHGLACVLGYTECVKPDPVSHTLSGVCPDSSFGSLGRGEIGDPLAGVWARMESVVNDLVWIGLRVVEDVK